MENIIEDRKLVQEAFSRVAGRLETAAEDSADAAEMVELLCEAMKDLTKLKHNLYRTQDMGDIPEGSIQDENCMGADIMKGRLKELAHDIRESIEDLSWIEDMDTFKKTQKETSQQLYDIINSEEASEVEKMSALASLQLVAPFVPQDDTPEWLVRKYRTDQIMLGINKSLDTCLLDAARL